MYRAGVPLAESVNCPVPVALVKLILVEVTPPNCGEDVVQKSCDRPKVTVPNDDVVMVTLFAGIKV